MDNIGIDETSYRKGHKYITVVVNHNTNTVVWVGNGHGKSVLEQFYKALTDEQLKTVTELLKKRLDVSNVTVIQQVEKQKDTTSKAESTDKKKKN